MMRINEERMISRHRYSMIRWTKRWFIISLPSLSPNWSRLNSLPLIHLYPLHYITSRNELLQLIVLDNEDRDNRDNEDRDGMRYNEDNRDNEDRETERQWRHRQNEERQQRQWRLNDWETMKTMNHLWVDLDCCLCCLHCLSVFIVFSNTINWRSSIRDIM